MTTTYDEVVVNLARDLAEAEADVHAKEAIVEGYERRNPGLRAWFTELIVRLAPILARQRELEERLAELEERVEQLELLVSSPTRH